MAKVFTKVRPFAERQAQILRQIEKGNTKVMAAMVDAAVAVAPVDTATYITSFAIYEGSDLSAIPALYSSEGREGGQERGAYQGVAKAKLSAQIEQLDHSQPAFVFGNEAEHRHDVEYTYKYRVFSAAAKAAPAAIKIVQETLAPPRDKF